MTSTTFARGAEWSSSRLNDGWGDNVTEEQTTALGALVVHRFDELAEQSGSTARWQPATSEVIGEVIGTGPDMWQEAREGGETTDDLLTEWREWAISEVWTATIGGPAPDHITEAVTHILAPATSQEPRQATLGLNRSHSPHESETKMTADTTQTEQPSDEEKLLAGEPAPCCICGKPIDPRATWFPTPEGAAICPTCGDEPWSGN